MRLENKCIPFGALPYDKGNLITQMMVRLFEQMPYLPLLPKLSEEETLLKRTIGNLPWFVLKDNQITVKDGSEKFNNEMAILDKTFSAPDSANAFERYKINSIYWNKYIEIINRVKPKNTVINLLGPFSLSQMIYKEECPQVLVDKVYRKMLIQTVCVKAIWAIDKIYDVSPDTTPIIILEEPLLNEFGCAVRDNEELTRNIVVSTFSKVIQKLHDCGCIVGIQCFKKCDWQIAFDSGVDLISFDAYNNPNNLGIIPDKVEEFLASGGYINWGIIPAKTEEQIKSLTLDYLFDRFKKTVTDLANQGININLLMRRSTVSVQQDLDHLPIIFAEKVMILYNKMAQKLASKQPNPQ